MVNSAATSENRSTVAPRVPFLSGHGADNHASETQILRTVAKTRALDPALMTPPEALCPLAPAKTRALPARAAMGTVTDRVKSPVWRELAPQMMAATTEPR